VFIGHWAPAFAAAALSKKAPGLGKLFVAAQLVDWGFFAFATVGIEKMRIVPGITAMNPLDLYHMPYTHSLLGACVWALAFALVMLVLRLGTTAAMIGAGVVVSHWFLDLLVHRPDLTLAGGDVKVGLGLWNAPMAAIVVELIVLGVCFWWYLRRTKGPIVPPLILMLVLLAMQAVNWFGPPPESAGLGLYLTALAAFLVATVTAAWVGTTRRHKREVGLAVASYPR
jgi:hypothetical protein